MITRGAFISFEGPDGGGKTTQIERLRVRLKAAGYYAVKTREIGGTPEAEKIRELVVRKSGGDWLPLSSLMLVSVARYEHTERFIKPELKQGHIVLSDRYADSTYVYQVMAGKAKPEAYDRLYEMTLGEFKPDLTIILDVPPGTSVERMSKSVQPNVSRAEKSDDRFEQQGASLQEIVRRAYLDIARDNPARCVVVDAAQDVDKVEEDVWTIVKKRMFTDVQSV